MQLRPGPGWSKLAAAMLAVAGALIAAPGKVSFTQSAPSMMRTISSKLPRR